MKIPFFIVIILSLTSLRALSQEEAQHPFLNYLSANLNGNQVYLSWEIKGGNTCDGINIFRSTDTVGYTKIGDIQGVCGSADFAQQYDFTDKNPVPNSLNYYKIELGNQGQSNPVFVHFIEFINPGYSVFPNPIGETSVLFFKNEGNQVFTYELFDYTGVKVSEQKVVGNQLQIYKPELRSGIYIFRLTSEDNTSVITGKFLI